MKNRSQLYDKESLQTFFMRISLVLLTLVILYGQLGFADDPPTDKIVVIGLDATTGKAKAFSIPKKTFRSNLQAALSSVQDSLLPVLRDHQQTQSLGAKKYELRTLGVGVGMTGQFGLGPFVNVSLTPRLRLIFSNSLNPIYPN